MATGIKSAYERALERLQQQGIEPPREDAYPAPVIAEMETLRSKTKARLAELEILFRKDLQEAKDPAERQQREQEYQRDRARIEDECERKLERLRRQHQTPP